MSWFDSSFSFAKTALSQAQKSIDKVLDIKEGEGSPQAASASSEVVSSTASVSPPSSALTDSPSPLKTHSSPEPPSKSSPLSTWFSPSQTEHAQRPEKARDDKSTPVAEKKNSSGVLGSTWGAGDSFWGSYFSTPGTSDQGGGRRDQQAPKPTSSPTVRGAANRKPKSPTSAKSESTDRRKKTASLGLNSPPQSSSTPLAQANEKPSKHAKPATLTPVSSKQPSRPSRSTDTGTSQRQTEQALAKESKGMEESDGPRIESKILKSEVAVTNQEANSGDMEASDDTIKQDNSTVITSGGSTGDVGSDMAAMKNPASAKVLASPPPVQEEVLESKREVGSMTLQDSSEKDMEVTSKSPTSPVTQSLPLPRDTVVSHTGVHVPSKPESTDTHSLRHHSTQEDSTETQQTAVTKPISSKRTKVSIEKNESKLTQQQTERVVSSKPALNQEGGNHRESKGDVSKETPVETKRESSAQEHQGSTSDISLTHSTEKEGQSSPLKDESKEEKREQVDESKEESVPSKEAMVDEHHSDIDRLRKELAEVRQVLEAREVKMVEMSREAISLTETNQSLQEQLDEAKRTGQTDIEDLRSEFTRRLATTEKKFQAVVKERDSLRKQLQALQDEQTQQKRSTGDERSRLIKEKDEQIAQLMEEGEKLSKQELQSNGIIKKLRQKDKQNDQLLAAQRQQIEDLEGKVKILKEQLKKKEENETKYQESLGQLNTIAEQQAKELASLKSEREGLLDKVRSLQTNLDNSYKELAELQKANAVTQTAVQEAAQTAEQSTKEKLKSILEQQKVGAQREKEALLMQVDELRVSVTRTEQQAAWREDHLRQELADMQQRLQEAETRNQELTSSISQATKPLLRQIENLQAAHSAQSANWDKVEASLTQRLVQTQAQLSQSSEKERSAVEKELTLQSRVRSLETQLSGIKQEKSQLLATLELERAKLQTLEESQHRESAKTEALRTSYQQSTEELRKEKEMLERQLEYERVRVEAESRKACLESQEKERLRAQLASSLSLNRTVSRRSSSGSQSEILEKSLHPASEARTSLSDMSPLTGRSGTAPSASLIEQLQSLLKQREGELSNSQNLVNSLERSRAAMAEDLANLSAQHETLKNEVETIPHLKHKLQEVERKHEAMLQMYGEKAEEAEELKLDIQDLKTMYRQQIEELLNRRR